MRRLMTLACCVAGLAPAQALAQESTPAQPPPVPEQIAQALAAAPEERADGATIMGFDAYGSLVVIRQGTNDLICLADDPSEEGFSVACYHDSLEPYMARGRALRDEGVTGMQRMTQRWEEVEAGRLAMPEAPAMLYVVRGDAFDASTRSVQNRYERWVLYTPFATSESTGLSTSPTEAGTPWIMFPGTAGAHIMISPPQDP
ncbi:MAG TPA: hypothetical protein VK837_10725 [Longimicrobiales bacterium]|nr:hypothetical protein [Longimicrobiales bacterium]